MISVFFAVFEQRIKQVTSAVGRGTDERTPLLPQTQSSVARPELQARSSHHTSRTCMFPCIVGIFLLRIRPHIEYSYEYCVRYGLDT